MMSHFERAVFCGAFFFFIAWVYMAAIPLALGTLEQILGLTRRRRP